MDYPPGYMYVLWLLGEIGQFSSRSLGWTSPPAW
jgi:hypothetical protein